MLQRDLFEGSCVQRHLPFKCEVAEVEKFSRRPQFVISLG